jgi:putative hydrolase of the HAD superfamily
MQALMRFYRHGVPFTDFVSIEFLQMLSTKYRLFLLSNTDAIHIETFEEKMEPLFIVIFTTALKSLFLLWNWDAKAKLWNLQLYVLNEHDLQAKRTLFIDDKKKILTALY